MSWVPPHKRPGYVPPAPNVVPKQTRKIRFPTNALNAGPEVKNWIEVNLRYMPSATPAKKGALKQAVAVAVQMNEKPVAAPTFKLAKLPAKYKAYLLEKGISGKNISKPALTRKAKKEKQRRKKTIRRRRHHKK
jgi:hypothetical protein